LDTQKGDGHFDVFEICSHLGFSVEECTEILIKRGAKSMGQPLFDAYVELIGSALVSTYLTKIEMHNKHIWAVSIAKAERWLLSKDREYGNLAARLGAKNWREIALLVLEQLCIQFTTN